MSKHESGWAVDLPDEGPAAIRRNDEVIEAAHEVGAITITSEIAIFGLAESQRTLVGDATDPGALNYVERDGA